MIPLLFLHNKIREKTFKKSPPLNMILSIHLKLLFLYILFHLYLQFALRYNFSSFPNTPFANTLSDTLDNSITSPFRGLNKESAEEKNGLFHCVQNK
jgi:hypothetical protein